jgi:hypothetical protein
MFSPSYFDEYILHVEYDRSIVPLVEYVNIIFMIYRPKVLSNI